MGMSDQSGQRGHCLDIWLILNCVDSCLELSKPFLEDCSCWEAHAACVAVEVPELLSTPQSLVLDLSYAFTDYGIGRSVTRADSLVCRE